MQRKCSQSPLWRLAMISSSAVKTEIRPLIDIKNSSCGGLQSCDTWAQFDDSLVTTIGDSACPVMAHRISYSSLLVRIKTECNEYLGMLLIEIQFISLFRQGFTDQDGYPVIIVLTAVPLILLFLIMNSICVMLS